jgi:hypothetical protein
LEFCIKSFGGVVGWENEASPFKHDDPRITHQVVDRPVQGFLQTQTHASREYIQPQWVFDSINAEILLPTSSYKADSKLPPHLSPFVNDDNEGYLPKYREEILKLKKNDGTNVENNEMTVDVVNVDSKSVKNATKKEKRKKAKEEKKKEKKDLKASAASNVNNTAEKSEEFVEYVQELKQERLGIKNNKTVNDNDDSDVEIENNNKENNSSGGSDDDSNVEEAKVVIETTEKNEVKKNDSSNKASQKGSKAIVHHVVEQNINEVFNIYVFFLIFMFFFNIYVFFLIFMFFFKK